LLGGGLEGENVHVGKVTHPPKLEDFLGGAEVPGFLRVADSRQNKLSDGKPARRETIGWILG
jgi:hypothetical protein